MSLACKTSVLLEVVQYFTLKILLMIPTSAKCLGKNFLGVIFKVDLLGSVVLSCSKTAVDSMVLGCGTGGPGDN